MVRSKKVALTVDLEEWTVPEDYGAKVPETVKLEVSRQGLLRLLEILENEQIRATFFVTAFFAKRNRNLLHEMLRAGHEIGSHGLEHVRVGVQTWHQKLDAVKRSTAIIQDCAGARPVGYREPYFSATYDTILALMYSGYSYDSSILGTWLPGKLQWVKVPSSPFVWSSQGERKLRELVELPVSVFPKLRIPVGWWWFRKNFGESALQATCHLLSKHGQPCITNLHTWELANLPIDYKSPFHIKYNCGGRSIGQIYRFISHTKRTNGDFVLMRDLASEALEAQAGRQQIDIDVRFQNFPNC